MKQATPQDRARPNPQSKGCVPELQDRAVLRPQLPCAKAPADILRDDCVSAVVLAAKFRCRPVPSGLPALSLVENLPSP